MLLQTIRSMSSVGSSSMALQWRFVNLLNAIKLEGASQSDREGGSSRLPPPYQHSPTYQHQYKPATQNQGETERPYMAVTTSSYSRRAFFKLFQGHRQARRRFPWLPQFTSANSRIFPRSHPTNFFQFALNQSPYHTTLHNRHTGYNVK